MYLLEIGPNHLLSMQKSVSSRKCIKDNPCELVFRSHILLTGKDKGLASGISIVCPQRALKLPQITIWPKDRYCSICCFSILKNSKKWSPLELVAGGR